MRTQFLFATGMGFLVSKALTEEFIKRGII